MNTLRTVLYCGTILILYALTQHLEINGAYFFLGFFICFSVVLLSMHFTKKIIAAHHPLTNTLELLITIPCTLLCVAISLFVTSPFILGGSLAMIFTIIHHAFKASWTVTKEKNESLS